MAEESLFTASLRDIGEAQKRDLLGWARLAVGALAVSGLLALALAMSRMPGIKDFLGHDFFYRSLITHVVFAVIVWYLAVMGAMAVLATGGLEAGLPRSRWGGLLGKAGLWLSAASFVLILATFVLGLGTPLINNYVPTLTHPLFYGGLAALAVGVGAVAVRLLLALARAGGSDPLAFGLGAAAVIYLIAMVCFALAWFQLPTDLDEATYNERLFWGGGHVLQFVYAAVLLIAWSALAKQVFGGLPVSGRLLKVMAGSLVVFSLPAFGIYAVFDIFSAEHRDAFTLLLWYGVSLPPAVLIVAILRQTFVHRKTLSWRSPVTVGFLLSVGLFSIGGALGYFLGVSDTRTPAHYHAVIGGVNLAFMALYFGVFLPLLGRDTFRKGVARWTLAAYGAGQTIQIVALYWAGAAGVPRKTAGAAQGLDSMEKKMAMGIQGGGAGIAIIGGIIFVWIVGKALIARRRADG